MKRRDSEPADGAWEAFLALCREAGGETFTTEVQQHLGLRALAVLYDRMRHGCPRATKEIADRCLGPVEVPIEVRAKTMNAEEVRESLVRGWMHHWGWSREDSA